MPLFSNKRIRQLSSKLLPVSCILLLSACAAQMPTGSSRVWVSAEDKNPLSLSRTSDAFVRVIAETKDSLSRSGFTVVDEDFVAAELGWKIDGRRSKSEVVEMVKLANAASKAQIAARAVAIVQMTPRTSKLRFTNEVRLRVSGELYDSVSNQFYGSFGASAGPFSAPSVCDEQCISGVIADHAPEIGSTIGTVLAEKLNSQRSPIAGSQGSHISNNSSGMTYSIRFVRFSSEEISNSMRIMSSEFPGYLSHNLLKKEPAMVSYEYVTTASSAKLDEWISILLKDLGMPPGKVVFVNLNGAEFRLERISSKSRRSQNPAAKSRFN